MQPCSGKGVDNNTASRFKKKRRGLQMCFCWIMLPKTMIFPKSLPTLTSCANVSYYCST